MKIQSLRKRPDKEKYDKTGTLEFSGSDVTMKSLIVLFFKKKPAFESL